MKSLRCAGILRVINRRIAYTSGCVGRVVSVTLRVRFRNVEALRPRRRRQVEGSNKIVFNVLIIRQTRSDFNNVSKHQEVGVRCRAFS